MSNKEKKNNGCNCGCDDTCDCGCQEDNNTEKKVCDCGCDDTCDCGCQDEKNRDDDVIELTADDGKKYKFYFIGTIEYKGKNYSAFEPAEEIKGIDEDDIVIFELSGEEENAELLPVEDDKLLDEVFEEFCKAMDEEEEFKE